MRVCTTDSLLKELRGLPLDGNKMLRPGTDRRDGHRLVSTSEPYPRWWTENLSAVGLRRSRMNSRTSKWPSLSRKRHSLSTRYRLVVKGYYFIHIAPPITPSLGGGQTIEKKLKRRNAPKLLICIAERQKQPRLLSNNSNRNSLNSTHSSHRRANNSTM